MKKSILILALVCGFSASAGERTKCETDIQAAPNPIAEIVTIPFKMVAAFSHIPRCLVARFPVKEEE